MSNIVSNKRGCYEDLFSFFADEHGLTLTQGEVDDIIQRVHANSAPVLDVVERGGDGTIDEIVVRSMGDVILHLEVMSSRSIWMGLYPDIATLSTSHYWVRAETGFLKRLQGIIINRSV